MFTTRIFKGAVNGSTHLHYSDYPDAPGRITEAEDGPGFFDFTFSAPKSVSIQALVSGDERLIEAHDSAVRAALHELELRLRERGK